MDILDECQQKVNNSFVGKGEISTKSVICVYKEGTKREQYWGMEGCYKRGTIPQITAVFNFFSYRGTVDPLPRVRLLFFPLFFYTGGLEGAQKSASKTAVICGIVPLL